MSDELNSHFEEAAARVAESIRDSQGVLPDEAERRALRLLGWVAEKIADPNLTLGFVSKDGTQLTIPNLVKKNG